MARIRRLLTFASQCGHRSRPPPKCFRLLAIPNGRGFCCGSTPERLACQSWPKDEGEKITTVSAPLKTLFAVGLVKRRHEAKHVFYALADEHLLPMPRNAIDQAAESRTAVSADPGHEKDVSARRPAPRRPIPTMLTSMGRVPATPPSVTREPLTAARRTIAAVALRRAMPTAPAAAMKWFRTAVTQTTASAAAFITRTATTPTTTVR